MPVHQQNSNRKNSMYLFIFVFSKLLQTLFTEVIYLCRPGDPTKTKWYTFFSCCCINHLRENNCWNMLREVIKQKEKSRSCSSVATTFVSKTDAANSGLIYLESLTNIFCLLSTANFVQGKSIQHEKLYFWKYLYCALVDYTKGKIEVMLLCVSNICFQDWCRKVRANIFGEFDKYFLFAPEQQMHFLAGLWAYI